MIRVNELFDIEYGKGVPDCKRDLPTGKTPLISSSSRNNGVYGYYDIEPKYKNIITVARTGSVCSTFYHPYNVCANSDCLVLIPKEFIPDWQMRYYCQIIQMMKFKYSFGRKVTPQRLGESLIPSEVPEWAAIDTSIGLKVGLEMLNETLKDANEHVDTTDWQVFKVVNLFKIEVGSAPSIREAKENPGKTPYISSSAFNNGIACYCNFEPKYPANTISYNKDGSVGLAFYQDKPYVASSHVMILTPKFEITREIALFLVPLLELNKSKYSFGRAISTKRIQTDTIKLPVKDNEIDWEWID